MARLERFPRRVILAVLLTTLAGGFVSAKVFLTQEEALKLAFPAGASVARKTAFLTAAQQDAARRLSGADRAPSALVTFYVGTADGREVGTAYFDTHVVRTQPESLLILIDPAGAISRIEILAFDEPEEYLPRSNWYAQFGGKKLDDSLAIRRGIRPVSGATLTARATLEAARRVLAVHQVLHAPQGKEP